MKKTAKNTVKSLRQSGFRVCIHHDRRFLIDGKVVTGLSPEEAESNRDKIIPKGGATYLVLRDDELGKDFESEAICNKDDVFSKKRGVQIALGRAWKKRVKFLAECGK